ncbi:class B sortase [Acetatifactor muris]|uniref:class B sortase n=1 Tax=Acetatifactor muris TaxID=879566 RepID=UPI0023F0B7D3|nr:class B sortase [Acetatifactor muris]
MKHSKNTLSVLLSCAAVGCLIAAGVILFRQKQNDSRSQETLDELRASAEALKNAESSGPSAESSASDLESAQGTPEPSPEPTAVPEPAPVPVENPYRDSFLANEDMAAWIQIPGTPVDYPVMWTPEDEEYYLLRGFDGKSDNNGCLILDTDSCLNPLTTNLIIHGHNMKSGAMFGSLTEYEDADFCEKHKSIILYTKELQRNYEVIAVFRSQVYKKTDQVFKFYKFFQADTPEEFDDFYQNIKDLSLYDTGVTAEFGDHFLTLSTCVYHVDRGRFVVVAKETEPGDLYLPVDEEEKAEHE